MIIGSSCRRFVNCCLLLTFTKTYFYQRYYARLFIYLHALLYFINSSRFGASIFLLSFLCSIVPSIWSFVLSFANIFNANRRWHIGISICNEFFDLNNNFYISELVSTSRWRIRVCPAVCLFVITSFIIQFSTKFHFLYETMHMDMFYNRTVCFYVYFFLKFNKIEECRNK